MSSFNKNLSVIRKMRGLTQREVADKIGISVQAYSRYENTEQEPQISRILDIANVFNVSLEDSLVGSKEKPPLENNLLIFSEYMESIGYDLTFEEETIYIKYGNAAQRISYYEFRELEGDIKGNIKLLLLRKPFL